MADDFIIQDGVDPKKVKTAIEELLRVYKNAGERIKRQLTKATLSGPDEFRLNEHLRQIRVIVSALNAEAREIAKKGIPESYRQGVDIAQEALRRRGKEIGSVNYGARIHTRAVNAIVDQMTEDLLTANGTIEKSARRILRATEQSILDERRIDAVIARGVVEGESRRTTSARLEKMLRNRLAEGQLVEAGNRHFTPEAYAELVVRTRTREAVTYGALNLGAEYGIDLFQVSVHDGPCDVCKRYQGKVYSISGGTDGFPRLEAKPPYHPRCRHVLVPFVPDPENEEETESLQIISNGPPIADGNTYSELSSLTPDELRSPRPAGVKVSSRLDVPASGEGSTEIARAIAAIDKVHGDGDLPVIPVHVDFALPSAGAYAFEGSPRIYVNPDAPPIEFSLLHEVGHFLDHKGVNSDSIFASSSEGGGPALEAWREAVSNSNSVQQLRTLLEGPSVISFVDIDGNLLHMQVHKQYLEYLLDESELFARTYTQYIIRKSGDSILEDQLDTILERDEYSPYPMQWQEDDFEAIEAALDEAFEELGWRTKPL